MGYLSMLLEAARFVANKLAYVPVLVHCTDGWDRTTQIISLAQIILDPHYRTFKVQQTIIKVCSARFPNPLGILLEHASFIVFNLIKNIV